MLYAIVFYVLTTIIVMLTLNLKKYATKPLPKLKLGKYGIVFYSLSRHKIWVGEVKILQIENNIYLKCNKKVVVVKNVKDVFLRRGYFYFTALGRVKIVFNAKSFYRYFNIEILSNQFDLTAAKAAALNQLANNLFCLQQCQKLKEYLHVVIKILAVRITEKGVYVYRNKFNLNFKLIYKINNTTKIVNIVPS